ncbi:MAG: hypothetical protein QXH00_06455 [Candidatus Jordarchaeales archaeon]
MFKAKVSSLKQRVYAKLPKRLKRKRAAFGIDAAIMIGFILAMMIALAVWGPQILQWFADILMGGSKGAYTLLIELPIIPDDPSQQPAQGASAAQWVGWAAANLYGLLQEVALGLLAVVLIIAAMCYIFETFRFMSEGTAMNIILNSVFALILIFAVRYIYNGVAAAINAFTGWPDVGGTGLIIQGGHEIDTLINAMGGGVLTGWDVAVRFFGSVVIFIICTSILILSVMMGAVRLLLIGCLAATLPLLLMLRLIPPVKHLADSLIETVIGIMFASIIAAILIHFGFVLVAMTGLGGITKLVVALATFAGAAYMSTMFAGRLGGLFVTMGGMASTASSMATGLLLGGAAMGAGGMAGGAAGLLQHGKALAGAGAGVKDVLKTSAKSFLTKEGQRAFWGGIATGLAATGAAALPSAITGRGPGRVLSAAAGAIPSAVSAAQDVVKNRVGSATEGLLHSFAVTPTEGESASLGKEWAEEVLSMSDSKAGELLALKTGLPLDHEKAGREFKVALKNLSGNPLMQHRIKLGLDRWQKLPQEERSKLLMEALKKKDKNEAKVREAIGKGPYVSPDFEALDERSAFYRNILDKETTGIYGEALKARMYALMREGYDSKYRKGQLDYEKGWALKEAVTGLRDEEAATWAEKTFGIRIPEADRKAVGDSVKEMVNRIGHNNPYLLSNLVDNVKKGSKILQRSPDEDLKSLEKNIKWIESRAKLRENEVKDIFDTSGDAFTRFWDNVAPPPSSPPPTSPPPPPPQTPPPMQPPQGSSGESSAAQSLTPSKRGERYDLIDLQRMMDSGELPHEVSEALGVKKQEKA